MPSMFDANVREGFQQRIQRLTPDAARRWGRLTVDRMVCHLSDQLRIALGELSAQPQPGLLRYPPFKQLAIDVIPWPKGRIQGPPEAFTTKPEQWARDVERLRTLLEAFGARGAQRVWPRHPQFGAMTGPLWSRLTCRHFDHHLRQFDV